MNVYIIVGYGIPKDISRDDNYRRYLGVVFNTMFTETQVSGTPDVIILSGGHTDCFRPYQRTEAGEMAKLMKEWARQSKCRAVTKKWKYILETKSLSMLENFVYARDLLARRRLHPRRLTVFCEATRASRVRHLAKKLYPNFRTRVVPVDFDLSANRYLASDLIRRKEREVYRFEQWALRNPKNLKAFRAVFEDKMRFLRAAGPRHHVEAVQEWRKKRLAEFGA
ncbi:MAG: ElyC/SanA/YdcF family protein [Patescibacteria group bacterium]